MTNEIKFGLIFLFIGLAFIIQDIVSGSNWLENFETLFEFMNAIISITAAVFAWHVAKYFTIKTNNGTSWRWLAIAAILFAIAEILGVLRGVGIWYFGGIIDLLEFGFVVALARGFWEQKKTITDILMTFTQGVVKQ